MFKGVFLKGLWFLFLLVLAWLLLESGNVFFAFIAAVLAFFSLIAEGDAPRGRVQVGGDVRRAEARDRPPFTYQLAKAGEAFNAVFQGIAYVIKRIFR